MNNWKIKDSEIEPYTEEEQKKHKHEWITCPMCGGGDPYVSGRVCADPKCEDSAEQMICCGC